MEKYGKSIEIFKSNHGVMRTSQAIKAGIAPKTLYAMLDSGVIIRLTRGMYALADHTPISNPDLVTVAMKYPVAVFCLITALNYYNLTEQIPHFVNIALPQGTRKPQIIYPPLQIIWLSEKTYQAGIQEVIIDDTTLMIYSPEKTITDCFKFRNKYGLDVAIDALRRYLAQPAEKQDMRNLVQYARFNRVEKIITPYLEALL